LRRKNSNYVTCVNNAATQNVDFALTKNRTLVFQKKLMGFVAPKRLTWGRGRPMSRLPAGQACENCKRCDRCVRSALLTQDGPRAKCSLAVHLHVTAWRRPGVALLRIPPAGQTAIASGTVVGVELVTRLTGPGVRRALRWRRRAVPVHGSAGFAITITANGDGVDAHVGGPRNLVCDDGTAYDRCGAFAAGTHVLPCETPLDLSRHCLGDWRRFANTDPNSWQDTLARLSLPQYLVSSSPV
jgi:hypothetical protein